MTAYVKDRERLLQTIAQLGESLENTARACQEALGEAQNLLEETQQEERNSQHLLEVARSAEETAHTAMVAAEGVLFAAQTRLATAIAAEAAAASSLNPAAVAAAAAEIYEAQQAVQMAQEVYDAARQAYELAKAHRELMEQRCEMAGQCCHLAQAMEQLLKEQCAVRQIHLAEKAHEGIGRLQQAHGDLQEYDAKRTDARIADTLLDRIPKRNEKGKPLTERSQREPQRTSAGTEDDHSAYRTWADYQPESLDKPIGVQEIRDRLTVTQDILLEHLQYRYGTDENFRHRVDAYRAEAQTNRSSVEQKIRKNMAGQLAEEIVQIALSPYGTIAKTQVHHDLSDGGYTKTDFVLEDIRVPLILGRGEGMGVQKGGSIAVEVKAGKESYLRSQREHIERQAEGHERYSASWIICTRDIKEMEESRQAEYRDVLRRAGSPVLGMLPAKSELDAACISFVLGTE